MMQLSLPDHLTNEFGETVFTALVRVMPGGELMVCVPLAIFDDSDDGDTWLAESLDDTKARAFAAELAVHGAGGGSA